MSSLSKRLADMDLEYESLGGDVYAIYFEYDEEWVAIQTVRRGRKLEVPELVLSRDNLTNEEIGRIVRRSYTHTHLRDGM